MTLIGMVNPPTSRYAAAWSHPDARRDWLGAGFYVDTARTLERGHFDMLFLPDTLAVPEDGAGEVATTLRSGGKGAVQLDPLLTLATVVAATRTIGLGATVSTGFLPPYAIARSLLTLDHLSAGRCAWNVVTSTTDAEARNLGAAGIAPKARRYDHADEVVAEVLDLVTTWAPDALVQDARTGVFADPGRVRRSRRAGQPGVAPGPMTLPRSPQDRPVLMQAGASPRGLDFAARWAEVVFVAADGPAGTRAVRQEIRERARRLGRDPDGIRVCAAVQPIAGATRAEAEQTREGLVANLDQDAAVRSLARLLHAPADGLRLEEPAVDLLARHRGATGSDGFEDMLASVASRQGMSVRELALAQSLNQLTPQPVGSGAEVAEELCEWQDSGGADGFVVLTAVHPVSLEAFVDHVVPELQRRGRVRGSAEEPGEGQRETLRGRLGLSDGG